MPNERRVGAEYAVEILRDERSPPASSALIASRVSGHSWRRSLVTDASRRCQSVIMRAIVTCKQRRASARDCIEFASDGVTPAAARRLLAPLLGAAWSFSCPASALGVLGVLGVSKPSRCWPVRYPGLAQSHEIDTANVAVLQAHLPCFPLQLFQRFCRELAIPL